jgi:hypothetical protein
MAEGGEGGRFVHLLSAPVRDLTQNWSIDIASELTSYLSELEGLNTLVDPSNSHSFNFAEGQLHALRCREHQMHLVTHWERRTMSLIGITGFN